MPAQRSSIDKTTYTQFHDDTGGLHVTELEFPPNLPRYSVLSVRRLSAPFRRSTRAPARNSTPRHQPIILPHTDPTSSDIPLDSVASPPQVSPVSPPEHSEKEVHEEKQNILDRRWFSWTFRRWMFVLGPCLAIVVMAVVLVAVFVTRSANEGSNSTTNSGPSQPQSPPTGGTNSTFPASPATLVGAFNGTSIATAYPGYGSDILWVFYQNSAGALVYLPLHNNSTWGTPVPLPTIAGVLNGTAIAALNYQTSSTWKINLIYQDETGNLRNFLYNTNAAGIFNEGNFHNFNISSLTSSDVVKRFSWFTDALNYHYVYYPDNNGLVHEYTFNNKQNDWGESFIFPNSNGYAGNAVLFDQVNNIATMHLINSQGELQMYWRNYTNGTANPSNWTTGATIPSTQTPLGFKLEPNSTVSLMQTTGDRIFAQEAGTGKIWSVGWTGLRDNQRYTTGVTTSASALLGADLDLQHMNTFKSLNNMTHAFVQQEGDDIAHLVLQDGGSFSFVESLPV